jgi:hypothetical protein
MDFGKFIQDLAQKAQGFFRGRQQEMVSPLPKTTPAPSATPTPNSPLYDFAPYRQSGNFEIKQPPQALGSAMRDIFGDKAERAAVIAGTENPSYDPNATHVNKNGSIDYGIFQVNSNTLQDFIRRKPRKMQEIGVNSPDDLKDPIKNMKTAKLIYDEQGPGAWYGPKGKGYSVMGGE